MPGNQGETPLSKQRVLLPRVYGWILLSLYAFYLVLNVLIFTSGVPLG